MESQDVLNLGIYQPPRKSGRMLEHNQFLLSNDYRLTLYRWIIIERVSVQNHIVGNC